MRIDSSGNVLVGKTSADDFASAGVQIEPAGQITTSIGGDAALKLNRGTNDGNIIELNKAGVSVGSIGSGVGDSSASTLYIADAGNVGIRFDQASTDDIQPCNSSGADRDNAINLGASDNRFKDLYLSGNAIVSKVAGVGDTDTAIDFISPNIIAMNTGGSEAMRIDSSGNLLVGKTTSSSATAGITLEPAGAVVATRDGGECFIANRKTSDGTIIQLRKDQTAVGSIGTRATYLTIGTDDVGLMFNSGSNRIQPENITTGAVTDNLVDLGYSGGRFKDLYLSGDITSSRFSTDGDGIKMGAGLGIKFDAYASGNVLDDYEEGSFTPTLNVGAGSITYASRLGEYTKVGRLVNCTIAFSLSAVSSPSGTAYISGLPFTNALGEGYVAAITVGIARDFSTEFDIKGYVNSNATTITLGKGTTTEGHNHLNGNNLTADTVFYLSFTYMTA